MANELTDEERKEREALVRALDNLVWGPFGNPLAALSDKHDTEEDET